MEIVDYELYNVPPRWVFLKLETDSGLVGWGEPIIEGRARTICSAVSEYIEDYIIGADPRNTEKLWYQMFRGDHYRGGPIAMSAIAGIDQALWDITGKHESKPVFELLGGPVRRKVRVYQWLSGDHPSELAEMAKDAVDDGYTALGMMAHTRPSRVKMSEILSRVDERVGAVRDAVGYDVDLGVDFRGRVSTSVAKQALSKLEKYDLMFVEEPVSPEYNDDLPELRASSSIPIATGQRMYSRWDFKNALVNDAVDIVQPSICHAGGISEIMKIGSMSESFNVSLMPKCPVGPIAFASGMHVQMALQNAVLQEQHDEFYTEQNNQFFNYLENESVFELTGGFMRIQENPGLGMEIDESYVEEQSKKSTEWRGPVWHHEDGSIANW